MRIAINALSVQTGGGLTFLRNLLKHLPSVGPTHEYLVLATEKKWTELGLDAAAGDRVSSMLFPMRNWLSRSCWEQTVLPRVLEQRNIDVLYAPGNQGPLVSAVPVVLFVQNVYPLQHRRNGVRVSVRAKMWLQRAVMRACVSRAAKVIAVSEYTRRLLVSELRCDPGAIVVIPHGRPEDAAVRVREGMPRAVNGVSIHRPYFLAVSDIRVNKNYETLLEAFAIASRALDDFELVIAGHVEDGEYFDNLRHLADARGISPRVHFVGGVGPEALRELYAGSVALVFPSQVESFGLPPLEAMTYGVPVAADDIEAVREICGTAPLFFDPDNPQDVADAMRRLAVDERLRDESIHRGLARAEHFSWERTARRTLELLREAVA